MATLSFSLSQKADLKGGKAELLAKFSHVRRGQGIRQQTKTKLFISPDDWSMETGMPIVPKVPHGRQIESAVQTAKRKDLEEMAATLVDLQEKIVAKFVEDGAGAVELPKDWLKVSVDEILHGTKHCDEQLMEDGPDMIDWFVAYIEKAKISEVRKKNYMVVVKDLQRYQLYKGITLTFDTLTPDDIRDFETFLKEEHKYYQDAVEKVQKASKKGKNAPSSYIDIYTRVNGSRPPQPRGGNSICAIMKKFRAFIRWANGLDKDFLIEPLTNNNPFDKYSIAPEMYGTPFYLTLEERNRLYSAELPPRLAKQRDIYVFQCLIGCRVGDLLALTKSSIINGAVEYIPSKTKEERPVTIRVPLNSRAKEIVERYKDLEGEELLPFISEQKYNKAIHEFLQLAGFDRMVTILNPLTREEEKRPLYEVATSHMGRRTFAGNLYKQVKDPNLVGKLTGHAPNSRAFMRYRDIDEEMAQELVSLLD